MVKNYLAQLTKIVGKSGLLENADMSKLITMRVGGQARALVFPSSQEDVYSIVRLCRNSGVPYYILGRGSNLIVKDSGYSGVIISLKKLDFVNIYGGMIYVGAGVSAARVGAMAVEKGLSGLEFFSGLPASIGGAINQNAGAFGQSVADTIISATVITDAGKAVIPKHKMELGYRSSIFKTQGLIVTDAVFKLEHICDKEAQRNLIESMAEYRRTKQPTKLPNSGSIFRNPSNKSSGQIIDECGLKGFSIGGAAVSEVHGNFIVNTGNASADDVINLIEYIKIEVHKQTGIWLREEVEIL